MSDQTQRKNSSVEHVPEDDDQSRVNTFLHDDDFPNWNDALVDEINMLPSVTRGAEGVTTQQLLPGAVVQNTTQRLSLTPQKSGVRGSAMRLYSPLPDPSREDGDAGEEDPEPASGVEGIQLDTAPRTTFTGILKKLEFASTCSHVPLSCTPVGNTIGQNTTSKRLLFSGAQTHQGRGVGSGEHSARRVTFGRVSIDTIVDTTKSTATPETLYEDDEEEEVVLGTASSMHAGSTPYSGTRKTSRITEDELASALEKSLLFVEKYNTAKDLLNAQNTAVSPRPCDSTPENEFSFATGFNRTPTVSYPMQRDRDSITPDFAYRSDARQHDGLSTGASRRRLTPQSASPSLLSMYGKAQRVRLDLHDYDDNVENEEEEKAPTPSEGVKEPATMPRRSPRLMAKSKKGGLKLSPTEQGIRNSLSRNRTRRDSRSPSVPLQNSNNE
jgi:hypothetical protein